MGLFGDFAPSVVFALNKYNLIHLPYRERNLSEFGYSKLCHLYCTMDKSVMFGFYNRHMAKSKVNNLNSAASILHRQDLVLDADFLDDKEVSDVRVLEVLSQVKRNATKLLREVRTEYNITSHLSEERGDLKYVKNIEDLFGDNLSKILLYGSSARGEGSDYDNLVVLKTLPANLYAKIKGVKLEENGKEVGIICLPEAQLNTFLYINVSNPHFRNYSKALKGEFDFPVESDRYKLWKELYHAGFGSAKLISAMNLVFREPEILFDKPGLFEYFMKLNRFTLGGLLQQKEYTLLDKQVLLDMLRTDFDFEIPKFRKDAEYLQEAFLKANKTSVDIAKKMYDSQTCKEKNEYLLMLEIQKTGKIFTSTHEGMSVYVFGGREKLTSGDVVPVRILEEEDKGWSNKKNEIYYRNLNKSGNFLVGKRI